MGNNYVNNAIIVWNRGKVFAAKKPTIPKKVNLI